MNYTLEQEQEIIKRNQPMLDAFHDMEWDLSEDKATRNLTLLLISDLEEDTRRALTMSARAHSKRSTEWTEEKAVWEEGMDMSDRTKVRTEFLASCFLKGVSDDFIKDAKVRWNNADFSSVSEKYLVIGDAYALRRGDKLPLKKEVDCVTPNSTIGRESVTYESWATILKEKSIVAVRPKINGERFVTIVKEDKKILRGFEDLEVPHNFRPTVVEYYAGQFYCLFPYFGKSQTYSVVRKGLPQTIVFHAHPFLSPYEFFERREEFATHRYDGVMIWTGTQELRAKWAPTVDVVVDEHVWEVSYSTKLDLERPRFGKDVVSTQTAAARIRAQIRGKFLLQYFQGFPSERDTLVSLTEDAADHQLVLNQMAGSKCLFFDRTMEMVMIREPNKRLDFIGGMVEPRETPIDAMVREVREEVGIHMSPESFLYVGQSKEITDTTEWISHVFIALAPESMHGKPYLERYAIGDIQTWLKSDAGRPRQVWVPRLVAHIRALFPSFYDLWSAASMVWECSPTIRIVPTDLALQYVRPFYLSKLRRLLKIYNASGSPVTFYDWLTKQMYWVDERLILELNSQVSQGLLSYPVDDAKLPVFLSMMFPQGKPQTRKSFDLNLRTKAESCHVKERDRKLGYWLKLKLITLQGNLLVLTC